jgi:thiol-disulfide isomerase/thioredoxin
MSNMNRLLPMLLMLLTPGLPLFGGDSIETLLSGIRGPEPLAVRETITVTATQDGVSASAAPVEVHVERTPDGLGRVELNGYTVFIDKQALSVVHESNDGAYVRLEHSGRPVAALRRLFADVPSIWVTLAFGNPEQQGLFAEFLPPVPDLEAVPVDPGNPASGFRLVGSGASGLFQPALPGSMSVEIDRGRWVPEGGRLQWASTTMAVDMLGTGFDPGRRRALDHVGALRRAPQAAVVGEPAAALALPLASGGNFDLAEHRGKVVIIDFWASWCGPCRAALPRLSKLAKSMAEAGLPVTVITVNTSERERDPARRSAFVLEERDAIGFELPIAVDLQGTVADAWGVSALPTTVIVGPDGTLAEIHRGAGEDYEALLQEAVESLLQQAP